MSASLHTNDPGARWPFPPPDEAIVGPEADTSRPRAGRAHGDNTEGPAILAAVGSPFTDAVIAEAESITQELGGTLHLVAAYRPATAGERERARRQLPVGLDLDYDDDRLVEARDALEDAREAAAPGLDVRAHLERGDLGAGLIRVAERERALLIVAGTPANRRSRRADARLKSLAPCRVHLITAPKPKSTSRRRNALESPTRPRRVATLP